MTIGSILLATALLLLVGVLVLRPLLMGDAPASLPLTERERVSAEKEALLTEIRQLDFDHETGKLPDETYQRERLVLMQAAAEKLRVLDGLPEVKGVDARIEAAVAAFRGVRQEPAVATVLACPNCGEAVSADDKFCRACGEKLHVAA